MKYQEFRLHVLNNPPFCNCSGFPTPMSLVEEHNIMEWIGFQCTMCKKRMKAELKWFGSKIKWSGY